MRADRVGELATGARRLSDLIEAVRNIGWLVTAGGTVLLALAYPFRNARCTAPVLALAGGVVVVAGITLVIGRRFVFQRAQGAPYSWVSAKYEYIFDRDDPARHTQITRVRIRANRDGVKLFENRYRWSAQGTRAPKLTAVGDKQRVVYELGPHDDTWKYYAVLLEQPLRAGETREVVVRHDLCDAKGVFRPFLAKEAIEPLAEITLKVTFRGARKPREGAALAQEKVPDRSGNREWKPVPGREVPLSLRWSNGDVELCHQWRSPRKGRRYELSWEWA